MEVVSAWTSVSESTGARGYNARVTGRGERRGARVRAAAVRRGTPGAASLAATPRQHTALEGGMGARGLRAPGPYVRFGPGHSTRRRVAGGNRQCNQEH